MLTLQRLPTKFWMIDFVNLSINDHSSRNFRLLWRSSIKKKNGAREVGAGFAAVATTYRCIIPWINQPFIQSALQIYDITRTFKIAIPLFSTKLQEYKTKFHIIYICHKDKSDFFNVWFLWLNADINPSLELFVLTYTNSSTPFVFRVSNETFRTHSRKLWDTCPV